MKECITSTTPPSKSCVPEDPGERAETVAVAGFLAGYCPSTRTSYATDLRLFSTWCHEADLSLFSVGPERAPTQVDYEFRTLGWTATSSAPSWSRPAWARPATTPWP